MIREGKPRNEEPAEAYRWQDLTATRPRLGVGFVTVLFDLQFADRQPVLENSIVNKWPNVGFGLRWWVGWAGEGGWGC
jgi:hypothetical protein